MNEDGTPIEGAEIERPAGQAEGAADAPGTNEIQEMYDSLGIKAPAPTGKSKGRPKAANVRDSDVQDDDDESADSGRGKNAGGKGKQKNAPNSAKNGASGNGDSEEESEEREEDGKVSGKPKKAGDRVHEAESESEEDSQPSGKGDADKGDARTGDDDSDEDESEDASEKGKRPGKSNPKVERRFQEMTGALRDRDSRIEQLEKQIQDIQVKSQQEVLSREDPEYTIDDFRKVRDENGNIHDLDQDQAELYYRRWKDGYDDRQRGRDSQQTYEQKVQEYQAQESERLMRESAQAFDTLNEILTEYPELDSRNEEFDEEISSQILPIIEQCTIYLEGTEPGNEEGLQPVIVGMRLDPRILLGVVQKVRAAKRSLPLKGINDNVDTRSDLNVPHGRSSDPTVNAANDLYKQLGIKKRL